MEFLAAVGILVLVLAIPGFDGGSVLGATVFLAAYFLLTLLHSGVRVGRKTYVVDVAEGDDVSYVDFIEIRSAIERLGSEAPVRDWTNDPTYKAFKRLQKI